MKPQDTHMNSMIICSFENVEKYANTRKSAFCKNEPQKCDFSLQIHRDRQIAKSLNLQCNMKH